MRLLGWLKFRCICIHRLLCITHNAIHRGLLEYIAQSIIIQSMNRSSRKYHVMKLVQHSISFSYSESAFSVIYMKSWNSLLYDIICINENCMSILNHYNELSLILK